MKSCVVLKIRILVKKLKAMLGQNIMKTKLISCHGYRKWQTVGRKWTFFITYFPERSSCGVSGATSVGGDESGWKCYCGVCDGETGRTHLWRIFVELLALNMMFHHHKKPVLHHPPLELLDWHFTGFNFDLVNTWFQTPLQCVHTHSHSLNCWKTDGWKTAEDSQSTLCTLVHALEYIGNCLNWLLDGAWEFERGNMIELILLCGIAKPFWLLS